MPAEHHSGGLQVRPRCSTYQRAMPFHDRADAGRQLADKLEAYADRADVVVLALPRGGVPVAYEVAAALRAPLDVLVVRRLTAFWNHEFTIGAAAGGGPALLDEDLCRALSLPPEVVRDIVKKEQTEVERRDRLYRGACGEALELRGRTVIVVDDGMATGASMRAAVAAVTERRPAGIVVAVPVASYATCNAIAEQGPRPCVPVHPRSRLFGRPLVRDVPAGLGHRSLRVAEEGARVGGVSPRVPSFCQNRARCAR